MSGELGVPAIQGQEGRKEQENVTTHTLAIVVHHVLGLTLKKLHVVQVIFLQKRNIGILLGPLDPLNSRPFRENT